VKADTVAGRADFGSSSRRNPAIFPHLAEIWLQRKFWPDFQMPDLRKSAKLADKTL